MLSLVIIFFTHLVNGLDNIYQPQPRISVEDGHLYFWSADHKNITFRTKGVGRITLNGVDISQSVEVLQSAKDTIDRYKSNFAPSLAKLESYEELIRGKRGILQRLTTLESGNINGTKFSESSNTIEHISSSISELSKRVRRINRLLRKNECNSNPCKHGATCIDMYDNYACLCPSEWEGPSCELDVNECLQYRGTDLGCQNGATCRNNPGSYECICAPGWFGVRCTSRNHDCNAGSPVRLCGDHGTCIPDQNDIGYKCLCEQGWKTNPLTQRCDIDVDECTTGKPPCSTNPKVQCINLPGSYHCGPCPQGYTGNGYFCEDINECELFNGGCSMNPLVKCINTPGSKTCGECPAGYVGDGVTCAYQGVCNINNGGCHPLAQCVPFSAISSTFVQCNCPPGYYGTGIGPNGCMADSTSPACKAHQCKFGRCIPDISGGYSCQCNPGYFGKNCNVKQIIDPCMYYTCLNGGTCRSMNNVTTCKCPPNYSGQRCEIQREACGGKLASDTGTLKYPTVGTQYTNDVSCAWTIETSSSKVINVTFTKFAIEQNGGTCYDFLQIHDGRNSNSRSLGRFCGTLVPLGGTVISTHNVLYLWFRSNKVGTSEGFELNWKSVQPPNSETRAITSHGTIQSPGSPGNYPNNRDYYWKLRAPLGKRIQFIFYSLQIGNDSHCDKDYLEFKSGFDEFSTQLAKYCNSSLPSPLTSLGPEVSVHFHSDAQVTYSGFQLSYNVIEGIPGCGGLYTQGSGDIKSPTVNKRYPPNVRCEYKIQLPPNTRIKLTFVKFSLESSRTRSCSFDYLILYAGGTTDSPQIGRYCGQTLPPPYFSTSNELLILFKTDWSGSGEGFEIKYEAVCGGSFTAPSGIISSRATDLTWITHDCIYEIVQPAGSIITLTIDKFNIEPLYGDHCEDYLMIRDGDNENSTLIGKYCRKPGKIISTSNYLWLKQHIEFDISNEGFTANYTAKKIGCGGILKEKFGNIASPDRSNNLDFTTKTCKWILVAPSSNIIQISWLMFNLEKTINCAFENIEIYENLTDTKNNLLGKFCGSDIPPRLLSTSNVVTITYNIGRFRGTYGFLASYNFMKDNEVCGGNYFASSGAVKSPGYPGDYPAGKSCTWVISVPPGQQIVLNASEFNIESFRSCRYDFLEIRNGGTKYSPLIGRFCGKNIPKQIPSHANKMFLHFESDGSRSRGNFRITWSSGVSGCGGILTSPSGNIISPHYPEPYPRNAECYWKISVSAGSLIQIVFSDIDLENHSRCLLDYIEIFDGTNIRAKSLGKFCNANHPGFIKSTSNRLFIKFRSDISYQGRGFQLHYSTVCNNNVTGFSGAIESPNFPNEYPTNLQCLWDIKVAAMNKINITFPFFQLETTFPFYYRGGNSCRFDRIEIKYKEENEYNEQNPKFNTYGTYCRAPLPDLIHLNSDEAQVMFNSDNFRSGSGFRLEWMIDGCGGYLEGEGFITSPNYPKRYSPGIECNWIIETEYGKSINITFHDVDIEKEQSCDFDYIKIYNGPDNTYPLLVNICNQNKPLNLRSSGNHMMVQFKADTSNQGRGFNASFKSDRALCGGKINANEGKFVSPNYPKNHEKNTTCEWLIEVDKNHIINLEFEDLDLVQRGYTCYRNYIKVYDGPDATYPLLKAVCGKIKPNGTISSTTNQMYVVFKADPVLTSKGFSAKFYKGCGARINTTVGGVIDYDQYLMPYGRHTNCSWTITAATPGEHVSLNINHMEISYCDEINSAVRIYNGKSETSPVIAKYCTSEVPPTLVSDGSTMHIVVDSDVTFYASFNVYDSQCGGSLVALSGSFSSPGYPKKYPVDTQCEWTLQVPPGNQMKISFSYFQLVDSDKCKSDYLEIRKNNSQGELLGTYCGSKEPTALTHLGNVWLLLKTTRLSSTDATAKGFLANFNLETHSELRGAKGQIASPFNRPVYYKYNSYTYRVTVSSGNKISLKFLEFNVDYTDPDECYLSYIEIFDGFDNTAKSLGSFCGSEKPAALSTTSNVAFIELNVNGPKSVIRFLIEYTETRINYWPPDTPAKKKNITGCGFSDVIPVEKNYTLTSPGFPDGYESNILCEWKFSTSSTQHLQISFNTLELDTPNSQIYHFCYRDKIELYSGKDGTQDWENIKNVCRKNSSVTEYIHSTSNLLKVVFTTDYATNGTGFEAIIEPACGGSLNDQSGYITFYRHSPRGSLCQWNITVSRGRRIAVKFARMRIPKDSVKGCESYVMLRNGHSDQSPLLGNGKYCGYSIPPVLKTTGNALYVKYSGSSSTGEFRIKYEEVSANCGGSLVLNQFENSTEISSMNYPDIPEPHIECIWTIRGPPGDSLRIDFEERFDLTESPGCLEESVEVRDGGSKFSPLIGKYCREAPGTLYTKDNIAFIKFFTDVDEPKNGFKAKISIADCGGTIKATNGEINSVSYEKYNQAKKFANCTWYIVSPPGTNLALKFIAMQLAFSYGGCTNRNEHVQISSIDMFNNTEYQVGLYCGKMIPNDIVLNTNRAKIRFHSPTYTWIRGKFEISFNSTDNICGGEIIASEGTIMSPGYPKMNSVPVLCTWTITVPKTRRVTLRFQDCGLNRDADGGQFIAILDNDYQIDRLNSAYYRKPYKSSGNVMRVIYNIRKPSYHRGFKATFQSTDASICGNPELEDSGTARLQMYEPKYFCLYTHTKNATRVGTFVITVDATFSTKSSSNCNQKVLPTYVGVFSGKDKRTPITIICNTLEKSLIIRVPHNYVAIKVAQYSEIKLNYTVSYKTHSCGGIITNETGFITSPNFPNKYEKDVECGWFFNLREGQRVKVKFNIFDLDTDCSKSYVTIHNGDTQTDPQIGKFCGSNVPNEIVSQGNTLLVEYHALSNSNGKGFNFTFEPIIDGCGGIFHEEDTIIQTPGYPNDYPNNAECLWEVRTELGFLISLEFIDRFHIEESDNCDKDFIEVFDWKNNTWVTIGKKCGRMAPQIKSTGDKLRILFRSNNELTAAGFKLKWHFNCGGTFFATASSNIIHSPGYITGYPGGLNCKYRIRAPTSDKYVIVEFVDFELEKGSPYCPYDNVTIESIESRRYHPELGKVYCGSKTPPTLRVMQGVTIAFKTNAKVNAKGFKINYYLEDCGGNVTTPTTISSPSFKYKLQNSVSYRFESVNCHWNIVAPKNKIISIRFEYLNLTENQCYFESVSIYDGPSEELSNKLAQYCNKIDNNIPTILSKSNSVQINCKTKPNSKSSFKIEIIFTPGPSQGCGGVKNLTEAITIQPPRNEPELDCEWIFIAPPLNTIKFEFKELNLNSYCGNKKYGPKNCSCSYIMIRDGMEKFYDLIEQICDITGNTALGRTLSTSWKFGYLKFHSRSNLNSFKAIVTPIPSPCGNMTLNATSSIQVLISPNFPNRYPDNLKCKWIIKAKEPTDKVVLRIVEFDLSEENGTHLTENNCQNDKLEIGDVQAYAYLGFNTVAYNPHRIIPYTFNDKSHQFCGKAEQPFYFHSESSGLSINFVSKSTSTSKGKGFKLEYHVTSCVRNYTESSGSIMMPYIKIETCTFSIIVPKEKTIALYFHQFNWVYGSQPFGNCAAQHNVEIYEGTKEKGTLLKKLCGYSIPEPIFSKTNMLTISFKKEKTAYASMELTYLSSENGQGCGGDIFAKGGKITSPLYPKDFRNNTICTWEIKVPIGLKAGVRIDNFDIQAACESNYLKIITYSKGIPNAHVFCKNDHPSKLFSDNRITVVYESTVNNGGRGWELFFKGVVNTDEWF